MPTAGADVLKFWRRDLPPHAECAELAQSRARKEHFDRIAEHVESQRPALETTVAEAHALRVKAEGQLQRNHFGETLATSFRRRAAQ